METSVSVDSKSLLRSFLSTRAFLIIIFALSILSLSISALCITQHREYRSEIQNLKQQVQMLTDSSMWAKTHRDNDAPCVS